MGFIKYNRYFGGLCTENEEDNVKTRIMENMYCCFVRVQEGTAKKKKERKEKEKKKRAARNRRHPDAKYSLIESWCCSVNGNCEAVAP